jgi:hypothetical protein
MNSHVEGILPREPYRGRIAIGTARHPLDLAPGHLIDRVRTRVALPDLDLESHAVEACGCGRRVRLK